MKSQKNIKNNNNEEKLRIIKEQAERLNQYIQTSKLAKLLGVSRKTISRNCKNGKYIYRKVKGLGGTHYEILLSSLEPKYINRILNNNLKLHDFSNDTYLKISEVAKLLGVSSSGLRAKGQSGKYFFRQVKDLGGTHYDILLSSLEPKYINRILNKDLTLNNFLLKYNFSNEEINLVERFFNGGNFLRNAVFDVIKKDIVE